jgi:hypothetical protein
MLDTINSNSATYNVVVSRHFLVPSPTYLAAVRNRFRRARVPAARDTKPTDKRSTCAEGRV